MFLFEKGKNSTEKNYATTGMLVLFKEAAAMLIVLLNLAIGKVNNLIVIHDH